MPITTYELCKLKYIHFQKNVRGGSKNVKMWECVSFQTIADILNLRYDHRCQ